MLRLIIAYLMMILLPAFTYGQAVEARLLTINELFSLAESNSKTLMLSRQNMEASDQKTEIAKSDRLPEIGARIDAGYIGNITILNPNFSFNEKVPVPHFTNNYGVEASQTLYSGNRIRNNIQKARLQQELSKLSYEHDRENIRMLLLGEYLELYRLYNQQKVYVKNIELANARLKNIQGLHKEGMVTKNDVIRSELQITDLEVVADQVDNNIAIINKELIVVLGLPAQVRIAVDTTLSAAGLEPASYEECLQQALTLSTDMKANPLNEAVADKNVSIAKAEKLPSINMYASEGLSRPYLYILPPQDIYYNIFQAGLRLHYNISSLYHAKHRIHLAEVERSQQYTRSEQVRQNTELEVNSAYIKYHEARTEWSRREKARLLADDNYRIVEKKYLNQLALLTDILDASTAKLGAELNQANTGINIIYQWYQLQKATGEL